LYQKRLSRMVTGFR